MCSSSQKTSTAVGYCKTGHGVLKVNGHPLDQIQPEILRYKVRGGGGAWGRDLAVRACSPVSVSCLRLLPSPPPALALLPCVVAQVIEPILVLGKDQFSKIDIRIRVKGGGYTAQLYAIRQCIARALVAYTAKYVDESSKIEIKKQLIAYDKSLLVADARRVEPKKFGGRGARARRQKSYR